MKKKLLISITSSHYARYYLTTNAFENLEKEYNCYFIANNNLHNSFKEIIEKKEFFSGYYNEDDDQFNKYIDLFDMYLFKYFKRSTSFKFRAKVKYGPHFVGILKKPYYLTPVRFVWRIARAFNNIIRKWPYSFLIFIPYLEKIVQNKIKISNELIDFVTKIDPHLIIVPNGGWNAAATDLVRIVKKKSNCKILYIIDNWDNLSTKSIYWIKPDKLATWGIQSTNHAINIQKMKRSDCFEIGTARFDHYYKKRGTKIDSFFKFKYILFLGCSHKFDEVDVLIKLDQILENNKIFKDIKIIYRPHPWRQGSQDYVNDLKNVKMDTGLVDVLKDKNNPENSQDLNYYPSLIQNAEFVIGGIQSMMIETSIFGKYFLALRHDDNKNYSNMKNVYKNYEHFKGIEKISTFLFCDHLDKIEKLLMDCNLKKAEVVDYEKIDKELNEIIFYDKRDYNLRLYESVKKIID